MKCQKPPFKNWWFVAYRKATQWFLSMLRNFPYPKNNLTFSHYSKTNGKFLTFLKSQISMEYLTIIGFTVVILLVIFTLASTYSRQTQDSIAMAQIDRIAKNIVDNAESVYYLGSPSRITLKTSIPERVEEVVIANNEILFKVRTQAGVTDIHYSSSVNISGSVSLSPGLKYIRIEAKEGYVWITT